MPSVSGVLDTIPSSCMFRMIAVGEVQSRTPAWCVIFFFLFVKQVLTQAPIAEAFSTFKILNKCVAGHKASSPARPPSSTKALCFYRSWLIQLTDYLGHLFVCLFFPLPAHSVPLSCFQFTT